MVRDNRVQIVFILFFFFGAIVFAQDKQVNDDNNKKLREEILAVYKAGGEQGLQDFVKKQKDKISNKFIADFAETGVKERKEEMLRVCEIIAEEKKDEETFAEVLYETGDYFRLISENKKAADYFDKAFHIYQKLNDPVGQANVYMVKGYIYLINGENSSALEMYDKALTFFEKAAMPIGQGNVYMGKGNIYLRIGENTKAFKMYDNALTFFEKAGEPIGQGNVYWSKGNFYFYTGENSKALEMYERAMTFLKKAGDILGQGNVCRSKGNIYLRISDNSKALEMYNEALSFYAKAGLPLGQGNVYMGKGDFYLSIGDNSRAVDMYDKALPFYEKIGQSVGLGNVYLRKGEISFNNGNNSRALEMYDKALLFYEKVEQPVGLGNIYLRKGEIYFDNVNDSKALEMYDKALPLYEKAGHTIGQGNVNMGKGNIYLRSGNNSKAIEMYDKAITFYKYAGDIDSGSNALYAKATVLSKLGITAEALEFFEKGIAYLEKVRVQTAFSEMKRTFLEKVYKQYEETVLFMLENKYYEKGFKYAESMKTRVFLDKMAEGLVRLDKGLGPELKEERDKLVTKLSILSKDIHNTAGGKDEKKLHELKNQYRKTENEFEDLMVKIRLNNPLYASVRYPKPTSVNELQKEVLKKGEILVRYFISADKFYVFLVSKKKFKVVPLKVTKKEIEGAAARYLLAIKENNSNDMTRFGRAIYEKLFNPLRKWLKKSKEIIIIPDGKLTAIPFESLIIDKGKSVRPVFLLEKYHIKYIQSASILSVLRKHYQRDRIAKNFIGFGDPVYDYKKFKQEKTKQATLTQQIPKNGDEIKEMHRSRYARAGGGLPRIQGSGEEVKAISRLFKEESQTYAVHIRDKATEENAKVPGLKDFDFIHFACHGLLNDDFQCLVLSQDIPGAKDDGYFTLNEIMNSDYNAKLVVLSACQTGSGKMERAEGVIGLTRAVMYAGTPAVLASLWKVDDTATKELMVNFYRNLLEKNLPKTEALRQAKLELLKTKHYASPIFWSAFVLYGE